MEFNTVDVSGTLDINANTSTNTSTNINTLDSKDKIKIDNTLSPRENKIMLMENSAGSADDIKLIGNSTLGFDKINAQSLFVKGNIESGNIKSNKLESTSSIEVSNNNSIFKTKGIKPKEDGQNIRIKSPIKTNNLINANNIVTPGSTSITGTVISPKFCNVGNCYTIAEINNIVEESQNTSNINLQTMSKYEYKSCYEKDKFPREYGPSTKKRFKKSSFTTESCNEMCEGYQYFGIFGKKGKCYCSFELPSEGQQSNLKCREDLDGNLTGNKNFVAVYERRGEEYDHNKEAGIGGSELTRDEDGEIIDDDSNAATSYNESDDDLINIVRPPNIENNEQASAILEMAGNILGDRPNASIQNIFEDQRNFTTSRSLMPGVTQQEYNAHIAQLAARSSSNN